MTSRWDYQGPVYQAFRRRLGELEEEAARRARRGEDFAAWKFSEQLRAIFEVEYGPRPGVDPVLDVRETA